MDELTIAFKIESPPSWLPIGRTAENNWRTVEIDCSYWFNMNANGEVVLMYKPSCGMSPYPLLTERDGDNIIWRPKSGELVEGVGRLQAFFEVGTDVIGSSDMISCEVDSSLLGADPGTDPGQTDLPWALDIIEQIAELSGHYPKIIDGNLYIWDSTLNDWVEFEASGGAVESVNGKTGVVVLDASDVGALPDDTQIPSKTSDLTNDSGFVTAQQAAASAPVQSVNGQTGAVVLGAADVHALPDSTVIPPTVTEQTVSGWGFTKNTGTYSKPASGIPKTDLAAGVIPSVPQMATQANMQDWAEGKVVDAFTLKTVVASAVQQVAAKANTADVYTKTEIDNKGYQTSAQVQSAIAAIPDELPPVTAADNGKVLGVVNGAWAKKADEGGSSVTVDSALSTTSTNPVQNKVVKAALDGKADASALAAKQDALTAGQNVTISGNTISADVDSAEIAANVTDWLDENVTPVGSAVVVDSSLSVSGSAADAKVTGDALKYFGWNETYSSSVDEADGYFNASGGISPASSTTLEKYTQKFYVTEGEKVTYSLTYPQAQAMWLSYCTYNANGGFIQRVNPVNTTTQTFSGTITVPNGVAAIAFSYRTYGDHDFVVNFPNPRTDKTLTIENVPADAKAAGERADGIQDALSGYLPIDFTASTGWRGNGNHVYSDSAFYHVDVPVSDGEKYHIKTWTNNTSVKGAALFQDSNFSTQREVLAGTASGCIEGYVTIPKGYAYLTVNCVHAESAVIEKYGYLADAETDLPTYFANEVDSVVSTTKGHCSEKALVFAVVTDSHLNAVYGYQVWNDTIKNIAAVNAKYPLDGIVHMGDIINGSAASSVGLEQLDMARSNFLGIGKNAAFLEGNHDLNSFYNSNADPINEAAMFSEVFRFNDTEIVRPNGKLYGYRDYDALGIRVVYLHSSMGDGTHGGRGDNWGYPSDELTWVQNVALDTEYQVLFISHMPMTQGHISDTSNLPTNGDALKTIVSGFIDNGGVVVGLFHGHTHWDDILDNGKFKEVSIGCEDYTYTANDIVGTAIQSYTPASAVKPARMRYTVTQDLWDVVIVRPASRTVKLVRFGAGVDRAFSY